MVMLYFSGTGNSKYIATTFSRRMGARYYSIEEKVDFNKVIEGEDIIAFCYPIYGSSVPRIMREFVAKYMELLEDKKLIIFCTQLMFSGDGARAFMDLLPKGYGEVIYAEHFNMPNNICNVALFPIKEEEKARRYFVVAEKKIERIVKHLGEGIIKRRGFNVFSHLVGKSQSAFWPAVEEKHKSSVQIDEDCIQCGRCVRLCPMKNLDLVEREVKQNNNCILCYRCVNACPRKAITVMVHKKPTTQYKGVTEIKHTYKY